MPLTRFCVCQVGQQVFDEEQPWASIRENADKCRETLAVCVRIIANLSILLKPFLPFSSEKVQDMLGIRTDKWEYIDAVDGKELAEIRILFERLDKKLIAEEEERLGLY